MTKVATEIETAQKAKTKNHRFAMAEVFCNLQLAPAKISQNFDILIDASKRNVMKHTNVGFPIFFLLNAASWKISHFSISFLSLYKKILKEKQMKFFCELGKFTCGDQTCIPITARCDGSIDCPNDRTDEQDCRT